ncbi:hypothetical protein ABU614_13920 [Lysobacter firmicutimachus]|uniref:DUF3784 domain-containing protein n=1 Tax=Lysobacter firmicutimachus TaxID=1792846 RepID=A0AAU8MQD2_9GAMM|nr:hypothetical protein [Lysobacter antibioticus]
MNLDDFILPGAMVVTALPILVCAVLVARGQLHLVNGLDAARLRDPDAVAARIARLLALTAMAMLFAALGYYWANGEQSRTAGVTIALLVAVNGLAVLLIRAVAAARRSYRDSDDNQRKRSR